MKAKMVRHGKRVSNTLVTYLEVRHNPPKGGIIPDVVARQMSGE